MTFVVGFTGTRRGLITPQREMLRTILVRNPMTEFHHGDCIGADAQAHDIVRNNFVEPHSHVKIVIHPPKNTINRAWKKGDVELPPKDYMVRNCDIVLAVDVMLATPRMMSEEQRSGTWHAIRFAAKNKVRTIIIWPNGEVDDRANT